MDFRPGARAARIDVPQPVAGRQGAGCMGGIAARRLEQASQGQSQIHGVGMRTEHLDDLIKLHKPRIITEIGVARCTTALRMIDCAFKEQDEITYYGFDLFEDLDDARNKAEFQGKKPLSFDQACKVFSDATSRYAKHGK